MSLSLNRKLTGEFKIDEITQSIRLLVELYRWNETHDKQIYHSEDAL